MRLERVVLCAVSWVLVLGACGPVPDGEEWEGAEPETGPVTEAQTVSQQAFIGDLGSALGNAVAVHSTCGVSNQWRTTCGSGPSGDISFVWRAPSTGAYTFTTRNSTFDTVLEIRNYRATSEILACNDDSGNNLWSATALNSLIRGTLLLITIEGYGERECGVAHLNIARR
ncbi:hypothetical protein [Hyalangium gracile]|uniref:hypothetical protein n=1 Tax=Hyalangium gracile TaxID=394092 RepID=UPI001CCF1948|nr:hypothetical protein [Hyalangium gracile]